MVIPSRSGKAGWISVLERGRAKIAGYSDVLSADRPTSLSSVSTTLLQKASSFTCVPSFAFTTTSTACSGSVLLVMASQMESEVGAGPAKHSSIGISSGLLVVQDKESDRPLRCTNAAPFIFATAAGEASNIGRNAGGNAALTI